MNRQPSFIDNRDGNTDDDVRQTQMTTWRAWG